jgi:hypothetical protein
MIAIQKVPKTRPRPSSQPGSDRQRPLAARSSQAAATAMLVPIADEIDEIVADAMRQRLEPWRSIPGESPR